MKRAFMLSNKKPAARSRLDNLVQTASVTLKVKVVDLFKGLAD